MDQEKDLKEAERKARRKAWDREYQRKRYHEKGKPQLERYRIKSGLKKLDQREIMTEEKPSTPTPAPIIAGKDNPIMQIAAAIKEELPADDPVAKAIDRYGKYVPIVFQFVDGFVQRMNEYRTENTPKKPQMQAPEGWVSMSALQREVRKYDSAGNISSWYLQGMRYEQIKNEGQIEENVTSYKPINMESTYAGELEGMRQRRMQQMKGQPPLKKYESMEEINAIARNEKWDDKKPEAPKEEIIEDPEILTADQKVEILNEGMREDVNRYISLVMGFFQTRSIEQFEKDLEDIDGLMQKWKPTLDIILTLPIRAAMSQITYKQLEEMLKTADPAKYSLVKKKKLAEKLEKLWEELKKPSENNKT